MVACLARIPTLQLLRLGTIGDWVAQDEERWYPTIRSGFPALTTFQMESHVSDMTRIIPIIPMRGVKTVDLFFKTNSATYDYFIDSQMTTICDQLSSEIRTLYLCFSCHMYEAVLRRCLLEENMYQHIVTPLSRLRSIENLAFHMTLPCSDVHEGILRLDDHVLRSLQFAWPKLRTFECSDMRPHFDRPGGYSHQIPLSLDVVAAFAQAHPDLTDLHLPYMAIPNEAILPDDQASPETNPTDSPSQTSSNSKLFSLVTGMWAVPEPLAEGDVEELASRTATVLLRHFPALEVVNAAGLSGPERFPDNLQTALDGLRSTAKAT